MLEGRKMGSRAAQRVAANHRQSAAAHSASHTVQKSCSTIRATPLCRLRCCCRARCRRSGRAAAAAASSASCSAAGSTGVPAHGGSGSTAAARWRAAGRAIESWGLLLLQLLALLRSCQEGSGAIGLRGVGGGVRVPADRAAVGLLAPLGGSERRVRVL